MGKFNKKYFIILICVCLFGLIGLIGFYNSKQNSSLIQQSGPILNILCKKLVNTANSQCNTQKSILQNKYTSDLATIKKNYDTSLREGLKSSQDALKLAQDALKPTQDALKSSQAETTLCNTNLVQTQNSLKTSQDALKTSQDETTLCNTNLAQTQNSLKTSQDALKTSQAETTLCNTNLVQIQNSLKTSQDALKTSQDALKTSQDETTLCNTNLSEATIAKDKCDSDLTKSKNDLSICEVNYADYGDQITDLTFLYNETRKTRDEYEVEMQKYIEKSNQCTLDLDAKTTQFNTSQSNYDKCTADLGISEGKLQDSVAQYDNCNTNLTTTKATLDDTNTQLSDVQVFYREAVAARDNYLREYNQCQIDLEKC